MGVAAEIARAIFEDPDVQWRSTSLSHSLLIHVHMGTCEGSEPGPVQSDRMNPNEKEGEWFRLNGTSLASRRHLSIAWGWGIAGTNVENLGFSVNVLTVRCACRDGPSGAWGAFCGC